MEYVRPGAAVAALSLDLIDDEVVRLDEPDLPFVIEGF